MRRSREPAETGSISVVGGITATFREAMATARTSTVTGNVALSPVAASYITGFSLTKAGTTWMTEPAR